MRTENIKEELSRYVVVLRSQSAAIFESGFPVLIRNYPTPFGRVDITFYTKYENRGLSVEVPRHLLIEVLGEAPSLDAAIHSFKAAASDLVPSVSFSVNAYIEMPGVWLAFDASDGVEERDFFQVQYFDSYGQLESARVANSDVIAQFHSCLFKAHDTERLGRAVGQYHMALNNWEYGKEIISIEHLFIAAEVITPIIRNRLCEQNGTDSDGLSEIFNIEKKKLDAEIRRKFIFKEDDDCYRKARLASDSFEHGYKHFATIRNLAKDSCDLAAKYLRSSIIELAVDTVEVSRELLGEKFNVPLMRGKVQKQLRGHLLGKGPKLAKDGEIYPYMEWNTEIKEATIDKVGIYTYTSNENLTACLGEGIELRPKSLEMWGPPTKYKKEPIDSDNNT